MPRPDKNAALDHVVVVMFENRSFDNLLGRLYEPGEVASFDGVTGKDLRNPVPDLARDRAERLDVPYGVAASMNTPSPDPGEEYQHVNTQLFGRPVQCPSQPRGGVSAVSYELLATRGTWWRRCARRVRPARLVRPARR